MGDVMDNQSCVDFVRTRIRLGSGSGQPPLSGQPSPRSMYASAGQERPLLSPIAEDLLGYCVGRLDSTDNVTVVIVALTPAELATPVGSPLHHSARPPLLDTSLPLGAPLHRHHTKFGLM